jgi:cytochrome c biogenesis protein CcdA
VSDFAAAASGAFWLGVLTAACPCLLTNNIAAMSFIARRIDKPGHVVISALLYALGQVLTFIVLAMVLVQGLLSMPLVSLWLQKNLTQFLGPLLILVGMVLLEMLPLPLPRGKLKQWVQSHGETGGLWGAALMGIIFALSFCPKTAALFFGGLVPLAIEHKSSILLPTLFGAGAAGPLLLFAVLLSLGANRVAKIYKKVEYMERYGRWFTGGLFITIGIYMTLALTLKIV